MSKDCMMRVKVVSCGLYVMQRVELTPHVWSVMTQKALTVL